MSLYAEWRCPLNRVNRDKDYVGVFPGPNFVPRMEVSQRPGEGVTPLDGLYGDVSLNGVWSSPSLS